MVSATLASLEFPTFLDEKIRKGWEELSKMLLSRIVAGLLLLCLSFVAMADDKLTPQMLAVRERILKIAKPLPEDRVFYRWQSKTSGENLLSKRTLDEDLYQYFQRERGELAGAGIYMAADPVSSSQFMRGQDGTLIEIHLKKGTPFIDELDMDMMRKLAREGILELERLDAYHVPVLGKFDAGHDWWVSKVKDGMEFHPFKGEQLTTQQIAKAFDDLVEKTRLDQAKVFSQAVKETLLVRAKTDPAIRELAVFQHSLPLDEFVKNIKTQSVEDAIKSVMARPEAYEKIDERVKSLIIAKVRTPEGSEQLTRVFETFRKSERTFNAYNDLVVSLLMRPDISNEARSVVLYDLEVNGLKAFSKLDRSKLDRVMKKIAELGASKNSGDEGRQFMQNYFDIGEKLGGRNKKDYARLNTFLTSENTAIKLNILDNLKESDYVSLRKTLKALITGTNDDVALRVLSILYDWEAKTGFTGKYLDKGVINTLLQSSDLALANRGLRFMQFSRSPKLLIDIDALRSAMSRADLSGYYAADLYIRYPALGHGGKLPPIEKVWAELPNADRKDLKAKFLENRAHTQESDELLLNLFARETIAGRADNASNRILAETVYRNPAALSKLDVDVAVLIEKLDLHTLGMILAEKNSFEHIAKSPEQIAAARDALMRRMQNTDSKSFNEYADQLLTHWAGKIDCRSNAPFFERAFRETLHRP